EPGRRYGRKVERPAGMPRQPLAYLRMLAGCVVVDDRVDFLSRRHLRLDGIEEADELLVPVALHIAADDGAIEDVEGREQCRCAMALVVVGHRPGAALLHRQAGLSAVERLDLALLIDREDYGMGGRIDIKANDVAQLADKLRVGLGERHDALGDVRSKRRDARWSRLVAQETVITFLHEAFLPAPDTSLRLAGPAHDLIGANTVGAEQDDLG